jgi:hypothetical protein
MQSAMHDRPTATELLEAVRHFLESDVVPALEGPKKFHARVAANLMSIVAREWQLEDAQLRQEWQSLAAILGEAAAMPEGREALRTELRCRTERLCERIRGGEADAGAWRAQVLAHLRLVVRQKLEVASPGMLEGETR